MVGRASYLYVVLHQIGDDLLLVFIEDLVEDGPPLTILFQQEEPGVPVLRGWGCTAVLGDGGLVGDTARKGGAVARVETFGMRGTKGRASCRYETLPKVRCPSQNSTEHDRNAVKILKGSITCI